MAIPRWIRAAGATLLASPIASAQEPPPMPAPPMPNVAPTVDVAHALALFGAPPLGRAAWHADVVDAVSKLGSPDFRTREAASARLVSLGPLTRLDQTVLAALSSGDPEVIGRAGNATARLRAMYRPFTVQQLRHDVAEYMRGAEPVGRCRTVVDVLATNPQLLATAQTIVRNEVKTIDSEMRKVFAGRVTAELIANNYEVIAAEVKGTYLAIVSDGKNRFLVYASPTAIAAQPLRADGKAKTVDDAAAELEVLTIDLPELIRMVHKRLTPAEAMPDDVDRQRMETARLRPMLSRALGAETYSVCWQVGLADQPDGFRPWNKHEDGMAGLILDKRFLALHGEDLPPKPIWSADLNVASMRRRNAVDK